MNSLSQAIEVAVFKIAILCHVDQTRSGSRCEAGFVAAGKLTLELSVGGQ